MNEKQKRPHIESEFKILIAFFSGLLLLPIRLVMFLFKKEKFSNVISPLIILFNAIKSAKFTFYIVVINIFIYFISSIFFIEFIKIFVLYPSDLFEPVRWFSFITHGFLHADVFHLLGNMFALLIFGRIVEKELGQSKTAIVYFSALIFAAIFSSIINLIQGNNVGGLGASGALMGLVSAAILLRPFKITFSAIIPLPVIVLGWLLIYVDLIGFFSSADDGIGYSAHIGGFISAFLLFFILRKERPQLIKGLLINTLTLFLFFLSYYFIFR